MFLPLFFAFPLLLLLTSWGKVVDAQAVAGFYSDLGSTIVTQDPMTGNFLYNVDSAKGYSSMQSLSVKSIPINGTAIASVGYSSPSSIYGNIFYQAQNESVMQLFFKCSYKSGECVNYGEYFITSNISIPIHPKTRLAAVLLSQDGGYRVTYEDANSSVRQLSYANDTHGAVTYWGDGKQIGNYTNDGNVLASTCTTYSNKTSQTETLYQLSDGDVRVLSTTIKNQSTSISENPTWTMLATMENLPAWNPANATFAAIICGAWDCLFYIDMNRNFQFVRSTDGGHTWNVQPNETALMWPLADEPNAPIAAAASVNTSDNSASVWYMSGGSLIQARMTNYVWLPVTTVGPTLSLSTNSTTSTTAVKKISSINSIKFGVAIGGSVALVLVAGLAAWFFMRKRQAHSRAQKPDQKYEWKSDGRDSGYEGKPELEGKPANITELDHDPECQQLHQLDPVRRLELRAEIPVELQDTERYELESPDCRRELDAFEWQELPGSNEKIQPTDSEQALWTTDEKRQTLSEEEQLSIKVEQELAMINEKKLAAIKEKMQTVNPVSPMGFIEALDDREQELIVSPLSPMGMLVSPRRRNPGEAIITDKRFPKWSWDISHRVKEEQGNPQTESREEEVGERKGNPPNEATNPQEREDGNDSL